MKNSSVLLFSAVLGGIVGMLIGAIAGAGTNVLLPGLGLVIAGSLFLGVICGLIGAFLGLLLGALIITVKPSARSDNLP
jgi:branched-subunit amino acid ABC-type transport system permease component